MHRWGNSSIHVCVPSLLVVPPVRPPPPPPVPGTVTAESLRPPADPPLPFLRPWKSFEAVEQLPVRDIRSSSQPIPCTVDTAMLQRFADRHDVETCVRAVFVDRDETFIQHVLKSFESPFAAGGCGSDVPVWSLVQAVKPNTLPNAVLGGKKIKTRHRILRGLPWTIVSYADEGPDGSIRRNIVYDDVGNAVAQVDFGHGATLGIHVHGLVEGSLDHAATHDDDHLFRLHAVPWPWMCIPDVRFSSSAATGRVGCDADDDDDEPCADRDSRALFRLPGCDAVDGFEWVPVALPFEDYLGDADRTGSE